MANDVIMDILYQNVPRRETFIYAGGKKRLDAKYPPWDEDTTKLFNPDLPSADRKEIYDKRWLLQKEKGIYQYQQFSKPDIVPQLNPHKKQYVVRLEDNGRPRTEVWKNSKVRAEWGADGVKYKSCLFGIADRWSRLGRGAKCGIITLAVVMIIGLMLTAILVPLYAACTNGSLTGTVCKNLGVAQAQREAEKEPVKQVAHTSTTISSCGEDTCHNGGTCRTGSEGVKCTCTDGYTGSHCEIKKGTKIGTYSSSSTTQEAEATPETRESPTEYIYETTTAGIIDQRKTRRTGSTSKGSWVILPLIAGVSAAVLLVALFFISSQRRKAGRALDKPVREKAKSKSPLEARRKTPLHVPRKTSSKKRKRGHPGGNIPS